MKYIDSDLLRKEIERLRSQNKELLQQAPSIGREFLFGISGAYSDVLKIIDSLQQEQPKLTQVPRIEQETQKKGWMDYGLLISEIGLHRSNAIDRIKETKERATEIKRNIAPHDLAILGEYLESAGAEIVLCCLQRYCMDFMFTQDEVKEIIQQEQSGLPGIEESGIPGRDYIPVDWVDACEKYGKWKIVQQEPKMNIPSAGSGAMGTTPPKFKLDVKPIQQEQPKPSGYDKALLEVKRMVDKLYDEASIGLNEYDSGLYNGIAETCMKLRGFIKARLDSDGQPEVDLEKEIDDYLYSLEIWQVEEEPYAQLDKCARHFYELGLKARKEGK